MTIIEDTKPLRKDFLPEEFISRKREQSFLSKNLERRNLHIYGPRGTGKTHIVRKVLNETETRTCYVSCLKHDTQYKALQEILSQLTQEVINSGYHTSELQRKVEEHTEIMDLVIVLDEVDFLLLNNDEDLLYFLSRLKNKPKITMITSNLEDLQQELEPRTYSSLQPQKIQFKPYTGEQIYEILADRASKSLAERSVHRNAVTYIASSTQNTETALTWLRVAAQDAEDFVAEKLVKELQSEAYEIYTENKLRHLSQHHKYLYQAVIEISEEKGPVVNAGEIYQQYQTITSEKSNTTLSNRRISNHLKQLEQLNLITAEYHYGGKTGKTREIKLNKPT